MSIIIPVLNEEEVIAQCLGSVSRLQFPKTAYEVIVVDNGSSDRTVEIVKSFASSLNLLILQKRDAHISALRNLGVSQSHGKILAFLDADCIVPSSWLGEAEQLLADQRVGIVGAHYRVPENSRWVGRVWYGGLEQEKQGNIEWVPSGDMLVRRETFDRLGGFDESIQTNEDCELCDRTRAQGLRVVGNARLAVDHLGTPQSVGEFYRKVCWQATDGLRVFLRDLPRISNFRPLLLGFYSLFCLAGIGLCLVLLFWKRDLDRLAIALCALLAPSLILSVYRTFKRGKFNDLFPLIVLYLIYGFARGQSILEFGYSKCFPPRRRAGTA